LQRHPVTPRRARDKPSYLVVGGAGFVGGHLVESLSADGARVVVYDNFTSGRRWHLEAALKRGGVKVVEADAKDKERLVAAAEGIDVIYHFASNPDIARAAVEPEIDFREGTLLTNNVVEAARIQRVKKLLYASGSGVYGDGGEQVLSEDHSPNLPISTYGASKLGCEALLCAYGHMFGLQTACFRFANVVGPRQTHGVGYDFVRRLLADPHRLVILGDGSQDKSYLYVTDLVAAVRLVERTMSGPFAYYNVATEDTVTVREIADIVARVMGLSRVSYEFAGGKRGWKGDVPIVKLDSRKIRALGWANKHGSREAVRLSAAAILEDAKAGRFAGGVA
jgi:UDP-glucose 4-epimerase